MSFSRRHCAPLCAAAALDAGDKLELAYAVQRFGGECAKAVNHGSNQMDEETFNLSIRKFLKMIGVNSQREIEQAVAKALEQGAIAGNETFAASVTLEIAGLKLNVRHEGEIKLQ